MGFKRFEKDPQFMAIMGLLCCLGVSTRKPQINAAHPSRTRSLTETRTMECTCGVNLHRWMTLYLKSVKVDGHTKYSVEKVNNLPTVVGCVVGILVSIMPLSDS